MNRTSVVPGRVELPTSTLSVWRSNQLSYRTSLERLTRGRPARKGGDLSVTFLTTYGLLFQQDRSKGEHGSYRITV